MRGPQFRLQTNGISLTHSSPPEKTAIFLDFNCLDTNDIKKSSWLMRFKSRITARLKNSILLEKITGSSPDLLLCCCSGDDNTHVNTHVNTQGPAPPDTTQEPRAHPGGDSSSIHLGLVKGNASQTSPEPAWGIFCHRNSLGQRAQPYFVKTRSIFWTFPEIRKRETHTFFPVLLGPSTRRGSSRNQALSSW